MIRYLLSAVMICFIYIGCFAQTDSTEQQLRKYKHFYEQGLIDSNEYKQIRLRILHLDQSNTYSPVTINKANKWSGFEGFRVGAHAGLGAGFFYGDRIIVNGLTYRSGNVFHEGITLGYNFKKFGSILASVNHSRVSYRYRVGPNINFGDIYTEGADFIQIPVIGCITTSPIFGFIADFGLSYDVMVHRYNRSNVNAAFNSITDIPMKDRHFGSLILGVGFGGKITNFIDCNFGIRSSTLLTQQAFKVFSIQPTLEVLLRFPQKKQKK